MLLSIITITYNNLSGLQRTIASVQQQTFSDYEQIVIDGASTDGTPDYLKTTTNVRYLTEPDNGIYDAQNKGIALAKGDYCFFLNAGDTFCSPTVLERMFHALPAPHPDILYGNELVTNANGKVIGRAKGVVNPTFLDIYSCCMKHQATMINTQLFALYGNYDASMRMDADWDWFMRVIGFNNLNMRYVDVDIAFFEATGFSYTHPEVDEQETRIVLNRYLPSAKMQEDYRFFAKYAQLRKVDKIPALRLGIRILIKLSKWWGK